MENLDQSIESQLNQSISSLNEYIACAIVDCEDILRLDLGENGKDLQHEIRLVLGQLAPIMRKSDFVNPGVALLKRAVLDNQYRIFPLDKK